MIVYNDNGIVAGSFRLHGSAALRASGPAFLSTCILLVATKGLGYNIQENDEMRWVSHPYTLQAVIVALTFVLTFRANFAYGRYWEGATVVHNMMSKWLDVGMSLASWHYQSAIFNESRPPAFGNYPNLEGTRDREREQDLRTQSEYMESLPKSNEPPRRIMFGLFHRKKKKFDMRRNEESQASQLQIPSDEGGDDEDDPPTPIHANTQKTQQQQQRQDTNDDILTTQRANNTTTQKRFSFEKSKSLNQDDNDNDDDNDDATNNNNNNKTLYLQELAHLLSLLAAVAMSTLRNDIEGTESPLVEYKVGEPWPPVDPDDLKGATRHQYKQESRLLTTFYFLMGLDRSIKHRTLYNAARPFGVLGGVSDMEIVELQRARGPYAKVGLCTQWVHEFVGREHLHASLDGIHAAIVSRAFQYTSDGMIGYNQSRKIAYVPFPFVHEQGTIYVMCMLVVILPVLYWSFVNNIIMACVLNFITVMCFVGLHEVARELENPFWNAPNDLPLTTFQAQFNEALVVMYAGFDPDFYFDTTQKGVK